MPKMETPASQEDTNPALSTGLQESQIQAEKNMLRNSEN